MSPQHAPLRPAPMTGAPVTSDAKDASDWLPAYRSDTAAQAEATVDYVESRGRYVLTRPSRRLMSPLRTAAPCGRPAHRMGDCAGRSPGSRVVACARPSRLPSGQNWTQARRLQLRGQPRKNLTVPVFPFASPVSQGTSTLPTSAVARTESRCPDMLPSQRGRLVAGLSTQRAIDSHDCSSIPFAHHKSAPLNPA
jgi:hypothetical protein